MLYMAIDTHKRRIYHMTVQFFNEKSLPILFYAVYIPINSVQRFPFLNTLNTCCL